MVRELASERTPRLIALRAAVALVLALVFAGLAAGAAATAQRPGAITALTAARGAEPVVALSIAAGPQVANHIWVRSDTTAQEVVITSPEGLQAPGGQCSPPPPAVTTEIRCPAGYLDLIYGNLADRPDELTLGAGTGIKLGGFLDDGSLVAMVMGSGADVVKGGNLTDRVVGGAGRDSLKGGGGVDALFGSGGADRVKGGAGKDLLLGGKGADILDGGSGSDSCDGGAGQDEWRSCESRKRLP